MLRILHAADFHLDSPFSGLTPEQAQRRREEQRELLDDLARLAREEQVHLVLLPGDLLDGDRFYPETAQALTRALASIPCPVFLAPGNHDCFGPQSVYAALSWPENVHVFSSDVLTRVDLPELHCAVWGRAFTAPHDPLSPLAAFSVPRDGLIHLGCLHGEVDALRPNYAPIPSEDIARSGLAYLALGHIHQCSGLRRTGNTFWAYSGCPQGRGFDETGEKGALLVEVDEQGVAARFVPLAKRRYEILSVDITGTDPLSAIHESLPPDTQNHIYRILLTGEGASPDLSAIERELAHRFYGLTLRDHTRLPRDLWQRKEEDTLTGLFLRELWPLFEQDPEDPICQLAARFGLAALEGREDAAP